MMHLDVVDGVYIFEPHHLGCGFWDYTGSDPLCDVTRIRAYVSHRQPPYVLCEMTVGFFVDAALRMHPKCMSPGYATTSYLRDVFQLDKYVVVPDPKGPFATQFCLWATGGKRLVQGQNVLARECF